MQLSQCTRTCLSRSRSDATSRWRRHSMSFLQVDKTWHLSCYGVMKRWDSLFSIISHCCNVF